ncbi:ComEA family DNA-binding protein [Hymenobacter caeli]|uniref:DNA uptake protein ComE-like DNA-binding protein n=1 Tax=Hymenobacter caeli TaxID=2735894 RepID=A0ABX2FMZ7_9BACT|nr:helix-hairpin-helix domain-containing protein [Hymenobacter caeli]NRT18524.1 DNA uptake protein ComE-like DNA-binding protein [Hymenobacter caeli]
MPTPPTVPRPPRRPAGGPLRWVRRYMGYSRAEARGMVGLLLVLAGALLLPLLWHPAQPQYLPADDQRRLDQLAADLAGNRAPGRADAPREGRAVRYPAVARVPPGPFDPNALTAAGWEARGVPHFVAGRIVKYRDAAGGFRAKAQIQKMYGLEDSVYQRLAPFMQLPDALPARAPRPAYAAGGPGKLPPFASTGKFPGKPKHLQPFDLNAADTTQLMQIRGIGAGRAKWVVQYRNQLGGYVRPDQLGEVFVLRDAPDLVDSLRKYTFVRPGFAPQLVNVNTASFDELYLHPYIRKGLARLLVAYRKQHGPYRSAEDLKQIPTLKPADWEKLRPYVRCD